MRYKAGGLSGSPVFVRTSRNLKIPLTSMITGKQLTADLIVSSSIYFFGLVHGHWTVKASEHDRYDFTGSTDESVALGIAVVIPAL